MELPAETITAIDAMINRWIKIDGPGKQQELEATFGTKGRVDATTFLAIAQRLQERGYTPKQDYDRLSIITQKNIRISLQGSEVLESYCKENKIHNIQEQNFSALRKHINSGKDTLDIEEYKLKLKSRTEETIPRSHPELQELFKFWDKEPKAFRLIKRWTFQKEGMRIDMSIIRSTPSDADNKYIWQKKFLDRYPNGKTLFQQPLHYEVEVELIHEPDSTVEKAKKALIRGVGEVLRGIQGNTLLIRDSVQKSVLAEYMRLLYPNRANKSDKQLLESLQFRGSPPITLGRENMEPIKAKVVAGTTTAGTTTAGTTAETTTTETTTAGTTETTTTAAGTTETTETTAATEGGYEEIEGGGKNELESLPNIRNSYNVTDKADGLRCLGFVNNEGEFYLIDMAMRVYRTGLGNKACANSLLDGEWIRKDKDGVPMNRYGIFDIFIMDKTKKISNLPFATFTDNLVDEVNETSRYGCMNEWIRRWNDKDHFQVLPGGLSEAARLKVVVKTFQFADPQKSDDIFKQCRQVLELPQVYHTDGLILTPNKDPLPATNTTFMSQFKWKPAEDNTVDFLVSIESATHQGYKRDGSALSYKELILYVNANKDPAYDNPRNTILYMLPLPKTTERDATKKRVPYQPSQFVPTNPPDSMASRCYLEAKIYPGSGSEEYVETEHGDPIPNESIVEMRYDITQDPGWRWIPVRIRHDKTERYARAKASGEGSVKQTINSEMTANSIWSSIHDPITRSMICTGSMTPTEEELTGGTDSRYYNRKASRDDLKVIEGLRDFHNQYIKKRVLYGSAIKGRKGLKILDMACGQAGDINIWLGAKASYVVGVDVAMEGLRDKKNGAYARYMNIMIRYGSMNVPRMLFIHGDSSKSFTDGAAGIALTPGSTEEGDMLMTVLGTGTGKVPPYVNKEPTEGGVRNVLKDRADVASCMFALHYFFKDKPTLDGFLKNLQDCVKMGGHFIACFTDGETVFNMLKDKKDGLAFGTENKMTIWSIRRQYDSVPEMPEGEESLGLPIDIKFLSLGEEVHTEYLVSYKYLIERLKDYGFRLLNAEELKAAGLEHSTNTFDKSYEMLSKREKGEYPMSPRVKAYSFTNRWIIVKRDDVNEVVLPPEEDDGHGTSITRSIGQTDGAAIAEQENEVLGEEGQKEQKEQSGGAVQIWSHSSDYKPESVFLFGPEVSLTANLLEREDKFYPRQLSPIRQFSIKEKGDDIEYPSLEHFWAAMKVLHAGKGPKAPLKAIANSFSCDGAIHREAKERLTKEVKEKHALSTQNNHRMKIALEELDKLRKAAANVMYDDIVWRDLQEKYLRYGLEQRWKHDVEFHKTVEDLRQKNAYLLYSIGPHLGDPTGLLAGKVRRDKTIDGDNLIGKIIMELAKYKI